MALDLCTSPRSGTDAVLLADNFISSGLYKNVLIVCADSHFPVIGDEVRTPFGHAGCALLLSGRDGVARMNSTRSCASFIAEDFVYRGNPIQLDARFGVEAGIQSNLQLALNRFFEETRLKPDVFGKVILNSVYAKSATGLLRKSGIDLTQQLLKDTITAQTGFTGVCHAILCLLDSLERNSSQVLLIDYYNGTNILHVEQTKQIDIDTTSVEKYLQNAVSRGFRQGIICFCELNFRLQP